MADIPSSINKINDIEVAESAALSEAFFNKIGATINGLIDDKDNYQNIKLKSQTFTSSGSFSVPANVDKVLLIGCGGGGGGGGGRGLASNTAESGGGGHGAAISVIHAAVTPLSSVSVTIGAGGGGGAAGGIGGNGGEGGSSFFGSIEFKGGLGGRGGGNSVGFDARTMPSMYLPDGSAPSVTATLQRAPKQGGTLGGNGTAYTRDGYRGHDSIYATGGNGGTDDGGLKSGGGGGGASIGNGGVGGNGGVDNATAGGIGAGGGGGCSSFPNGGSGRAGGNGQITVIWVAE